MTTLLARLDALITHARIRRWTTVMLACQLVVFVAIVLALYGLFTRLDRTFTTDFVSFYSAGFLANGAHPALVYNRAVHFAIEQAIVAPDIRYFHFFYPPVFLLICGLLAHLPYVTAFIVFDTTTTIACILAVRAITGMQNRDCVLTVLSFSPLLWNVGFGQNACLTAALFGFGTLLLERRRPIAAGLVLSCLMFKPHTGLLIPVALVASRSWRAFASATMGVLLLVAISALMFGIQPWRLFVTAIMHAEGQFAGEHVAPFVALASVFGAGRMVGLPSSMSFSGEVLVSCLVVVAVWRTWRKPVTSGVRYAVLVAGTQLIMPVILFYDTTWLVVAAAWLVRDQRAIGALEGESAGLALIWLLGLMCYPMTLAWHLPLAVGMEAGLFALVLRRANAASHLPNGNADLPVFPRRWSSPPNRDFNHPCRCSALAEASAAKERTD